jgi:hypothetical protein
MHFKNTASKNSLLYLVLTIVLLPGCAHYRTRPLKTLPVPLASEKQSVAFAYKVFDKKDCKKYLGRDLTKKGYQPIQLTIHNNSPRSLGFYLSAFSVRCAALREVINRAHFSTAGRVLGYGAPGVAWTTAFIWQTTTVGAASGLFLLPALAVWSLTFVPAIVDGIASVKANKKLDADYKHKALRDQILYPYHILNGVIFVPYKDFNEHFSFSLTDHENNKHFTLNSLQQSTNIELNG